MNTYLENIGSSQEVINWFEKRVKEPCDLSEQEHIADFLISKDCPKKFAKMTYDELKSATDKWTKKLAKQAKDIKELEEDTEIVKEWKKEGFKFVKLVGKNAYEREGKLMRHCVSSYYGKDDEIYSLRDAKNNPHCTISKSSQQIKGKGNGSIHPKYIKYVVEFLEYLKIDVRDSEMKNLGYANVEKLAKHLDKKQLFRKKYWFIFDKLIGKDGNEFACLELLDSVDLISETNSGLKINFELKSFIKLSLDFLKKTNKKIGGYSSQNASSGESSQNANSGDYSQNASSGDSSQNASSGNYSKNASSGYYSQNASSGDYSKNANSGNYSQNAMTGLHSVSVDAGHNGQAKGKIGCWFALTEWEKKEGVWIPKCVKATKIDGKKIKEDTWYTLKNGKFIILK